MRERVSAMKKDAEAQEKVNVRLVGKLYELQEEIEGA